MNADKKLAVITGASQGIGFELAKVFAKNGYDLVINSETALIDQAAADLRNLGVEVTPVIADLSTRTGVDEFFDQISLAGRPVDCAILNAGVGIDGEFIQNDFEDELNVMNLNVVNTVYLAKLILTDMCERNAGRLMFTSSIAAEMPGPYNAIYAASKAFIQSFAQALHYEMKDMKRNVTITALQPGPTDTNFFDRANMLDTKVGEAKKDDPAQVAQQGFDAMMAGKDHVVAGSMKNRIQVAGGKILTEQMGAAAHSAQSKPKELNH